jgi:hypothetical protein
VSAVRVLTARLTGDRRRVTAKVVVVRPQPAPRRTRRAGLAVALGLAAFAACQLLTDQAIRNEWVPLRDPIYFDKLDLLRTHPAFFQPPAEGRPLTVLCLGSSRTLNAVDPDVLGPALAAELGRPVEAFNFGQAGAGPVTVAVYARRLIAAGVRPDVVLVEVHPAFLAGQRPDPPESRWLLPVRLRPEELPLVRAMGFPADDPPAHGLRGRLAPWYEYRYLIVDRYAPFLLMGGKLNAGHEPNARGFARHPPVEPDDARVLLALTRRQYADHMPGFRPNGCGVNAVRDTLGQCRAAGWRTVMVMLPESSVFRGWYDPDGFRQIDAVVGGLSAEFGTPVIDARTWVPDELVADGHHLTGPGADVVSEKLARDALAPWLKAP